MVNRVAFPHASVYATTLRQVVAPAITCGERLCLRVKTGIAEPREIHVWIGLAAAIVCRRIALRDTKGLNLKSGFNSVGQAVHWQLHF